MTDDPPPVRNLDTWIDEMANRAAELAARLAEPRPSPTPRAATDEEVAEIALYLEQFLMRGFPRGDAFVHARAIAALLAEPATPATGGETDG